MIYLDKKLFELIKSIIYLFNKMNSRLNLINESQDLRSKKIEKFIKILIKNYI